VLKSGEKHKKVMTHLKKVKLPASAQPYKDLSERLINYPLAIFDNALNGMQVVQSAPSPASVHHAGNQFMDSAAGHPVVGMTVMNPWM
jgi:hypothetical protein